MKPSGNPANAAVVIVAVEKTRFYESDPLVGLVDDALCMAQWALDLGVPQEQVLLFVSPKPQYEERLTTWLQAHPGVRRSTAEEARVVDGLGLLRGMGGRKSWTLIVLWAGHGVVNVRDTPHTRRLLFADAAPPPDGPVRNMNVAALQHFMQGLKGFDQQVLIVDACATSSATVQIDEQLGPGCDLGRSDRVKPQALYPMFATSPGEEAYPDASAEVGVKSRFLRQLHLGLKPAKEEPWPDFHAAFEAAKVALNGSGQTPMSFGDDTDEILGTRHATLLLRTLETYLDIQGALDAAFHAVWAGDAMAATTARAGQNLARRIELLSQGTRAGEFSRLQNFVLEVAARIDARPHEPLLGWLRTGREPLSLATITSELKERKRALARAARPEPLLLFVLIQEKSHPDHPSSMVLEGCVYENDAELPMLLDDESPIEVHDAESRAAAIGRIVLLARQHCYARSPGGEAILVLEFALPIQRLCESLESICYDEDGQLPLGEHHLVVRRLAERQLCPQVANVPVSWYELNDKWRRNAEELRGRLQRTGLAFVAVRPAALKQKLGALLKGQAAGSCVLIEDPAQDAGGLHASTLDSLRAGAHAFASWSCAPCEGRDTATIDAELKGFLGLDALRRCHEVRLNDFTGEGALSQLVFLWDDPRRVPANVSLGQIGQF